jgi:hypothetical protein
MGRGFDIPWIGGLSMVYQIHLLIRNEGAQNTMGVQFTIQGGGGQFSIRGFNIPWKKINRGSKI